MNDPKGYVLGQNERAARRLEIQDQHFGGHRSDCWTISPSARAIASWNLAAAPGSLSRRILARLGPSGILVGVDATKGLLDQAASALAGKGHFEPTPADVTTLGPWLDGADVVVGRAILHHIPMAELFVGRATAACGPERESALSSPTFAVHWLALPIWKPPAGPNSAAAESLGHDDEPTLSVAAHFAGGRRDACACDGDRGLRERAHPSGSNARPTPS